VVWKIRFDYPAVSPSYNYILPGFGSSCVRVIGLIAEGANWGSRDYFVSLRHFYFLSHF
jgi:hypothetical protein